LLVGDTEDAGCVVIGRNEGQRLVRCFASVTQWARWIVYVDSGSTDGSKERAREAGAEIFELDMSTPFTAARARNAGFRALMRSRPGCPFVQFVDGDSEIHPEWPAHGAAHLRAHPTTAVVFGRQHERNPRLTPFNRLLDIEWDTPRGVVKSCAGNAMMRASTFETVGGFREDLIAGEEPELCVRIRAAGQLIEALEPPMAVHDAGALGFREWWRRSVRAGHAFAEGAHLHGGAPERHCVLDVARIVFWAAMLPLVALGTAPFTRWFSVLLLPVGYATTAFRVYRHTLKRGRGSQDARLAAALTTLGKFAQLQGVILFHVRRVLGLRRSLIEYKRGARQ
jgi:hypothetical protein